MNRFVLLTLLPTFLFSCSNNPANHPAGSTTKLETENNLVENAENPNPVSSDLEIMQPEIIDDSDWLIFPLAHKARSKTPFGSKRSYNNPGYWNIAFYNIKTGQTRLLSDSLKMIIHSHQIKTRLVARVEGQLEKSERMLFYLIGTKDANRDGKLNFADPKYLFVSDLSGNNFRQISPDGYDVVDWWHIDGTAKILIQTRKYSDKKQDKAPVNIFFSYDLDTGKPEPVFKNDFVLKTRQLHRKLWAESK